MKPEHRTLLSTFAFNVKLRRYDAAAADAKLAALDARLAAADAEEVGPHR